MSPADTNECVVCARSDRDDLDERLAFDQETVASLAASTRLPIEAVWQHRNGHLDDEWSSLVAESGGAFASAAHLKALAWDDMMDVRSIARDPRRRDRARIDAHGQNRGYQEMLFKLVDDRPPTMFDDLLNNPAVADLLAIIRATVEPFPGAIAALDNRLIVTAEIAEDDHADDRTP